MLFPPYRATGVPGHYPGSADLNQGCLWGNKPHLGSSSQKWSPTIHQDWEVKPLTGGFAAPLLSCWTELPPTPQTPKPPNPKAPTPKPLNPQPHWGQDHFKKHEGQRPVKRLGHLASEISAWAKYYSRLRGNLRKLVEIGVSQNPQNGIGVPFGFPFNKKHKNWVPSTNDTHTRTHTHTQQCPVNPETQA